MAAVTIVKETGTFSEKKLQNTTSLGLGKREVNVGLISETESNPGYKRRTETANNCPWEKHLPYLRQCFKENSHIHTFMERTKLIRVHHY